MESNDMDTDLPPLPALVREIENCITARHLDAALALCSNLRAAIAAVPAQPVLDCEIQPRPLAYPLTDYHRAGVDGPLHYTWKDKPHRLLYDLIAAVRYYAAPQAVPTDKDSLMVAQAVPVPAGWALVPVEPTPEVSRAELRRQHAEIERLRADAARYRWLRDENTDLDKLAAKEAAINTGEKK